MSGREKRGNGWIAHINNSTSKGTNSSWRRKAESRVGNALPSTRVNIKQGAREPQTAHHRHYQYAPASLNNASLEQVQLTNETQQRDGACQNNQVPSTPP